MQGHSGAPPPHGHPQRYASQQWHPYPGQQPPGQQRAPPYGASPSPQAPGHMHPPAAPYVNYHAQQQQQQQPQQQHYGAGHQVAYGGHYQQQYHQQQPQHQYAQHQSQQPYAQQAQPQQPQQSKEWDPTARLTSVLAATTAGPPIGPAGPPGIVAAQGSAAAVAGPAAPPAQEIGAKFSAKHIHSTPAESAGGPKRQPASKLRTAAGEVWHDPNLDDWDENDYRLFVGNLGNDVTTDFLSETFRKYPSFVRARVVRDKKTLRTKGYGFVALKDPLDFLAALKEMNGAYIGNRPCVCKKSAWKKRQFTEARKRLGRKELKAQIKLRTHAKRSKRD